MIRMNVTRPMYIESQLYFTPLPGFRIFSLKSFSSIGMKMTSSISPSGMPASKGILTDAELWSIVIYLRHLPQAGSLGEPQMYSGDDDKSPCPTLPAQRR